jgi:ABC-type bacteriocin/lantibiotic exporter with double-glycine peptidase domain
MKVPDRHPCLIVPEVVQTSAMDCGPASLKCVLEGFGIPVSYGRLREACQTDVDGTSIDTVEEVAVQLGLDAEQIILPADYLLSREAGALPAIVVVRLPNGVTHFVVLWRRLGPFVQVMDPATGRRWPTREQFLSSLYIHVLPVQAATWLQWARSDQFVHPLRRKLNALGLRQQSCADVLGSAVKAESWRPLAALEASTRTVEAMVCSGGLPRGKEAAHVLEQLFKKVCGNTAEGARAIPTHYWSVRTAPPGPNGEEQVLLQGAVLVHLRGRLSAAQLDAPSGTSQKPIGAPLSPELVAALEEPPSRPGRELLRLLRADGAVSPIALGCALLLAAAGVMVEAVLFRGLLGMGRELGLSGQRLGAMGALGGFLAGLLLLEFPIAAGLLRMGRHLESRLRIAFLQKIPRLGDRYFHSRLNSDMAERSHLVHRVRLLPQLGGELLRSSFELILTAAGIIWLDPRTAPIAILAAVLALALPLLAQPLLAERDLRLRSHVGALSRFYLDAFLGLVPVRTHGAERAMRREHEGLLMEWARAGLGLQRVVVWIEGLQFFAGFALAAWLLLNHVGRFGESGGTLLLVYWALSLPVLGQEVAIIAWQYPAHRNVTLRLLEPMGAIEEVDVAQPDTQQSARPAMPVRSSRGISLSFEEVSVRVAGHTILHEIDLKVEAGEHVAVVGVSGAGKSSLVGVLLGWHRPAEGNVFADGLTLDGARLKKLRQETAWVEPAVQLWNRSLFDNLRYGAPPDALPSGLLLEQSNLRELLEKLPEGLQTELGEGGALVSGGEGQRVRLARALLKPGVRLAILDEPFRGLDRQQRRDLLTRARKHWQEVTLICVTHDVSETLAFPRVLVIERGRIVESGLPAQLASVAGSRYRTMLEAEESVREDLWSSSDWRHLWLEEGRLAETATRGVLA